MPRRKEKDARIISIYLRRRFIKELDIERGDISRGEFIEQIFRNYDREKLDMLKEIELLKRRIKELEQQLAMASAEEFRNFKKRVLVWWNRLGYFDRRRVDQYPIWHEYKEQYLLFRKIRKRGDKELDKIFKIS